MIRLFLCAFMLLGCAARSPVSIDYLNSNKYSVTNISDVEFFISRQPNREFEEIALMSISSWVGGTIDSNKISWFKHEASLLGADAVIYKGANTGMAGTNPGSGAGYSEQIFTAVAIKYLK